MTVFLEKKKKEYGVILDLQLKVELKLSCWEGGGGREINCTNMPAGMSHTSRSVGHKYVN